MLMPGEDSETVIDDSHFCSQTTSKFVLEFCEDVGVHGCDFGGVTNQLLCVKIKGICSLKAFKFKRLLEGYRNSSALSVITPVYCHSFYHLLLPMPCQRSTG